MERRPFIVRVRIIRKIRNKRGKRALYSREKDYRKEEKGKGSSTVRKGL